MSADTENSLDLVWGAKGISQVIGRSPRVVFNMLENGELPGARQIGGRWVIERPKLIAVFKGEAA